MLNGSTFADPSGEAITGIGQMPLKPWLKGVGVREKTRDGPRRDAAQRVAADHAQHNQVQAGWADTTSIKMELR
jgi:hypothetical protein